MLRRYLSLFWQLESGITTPVTCFVTGLTITEWRVRLLLPFYVILVVIVLLLSVTNLGKDVFGVLGCYTARDTGVSKQPIGPIFILDFSTSCN
jgi:hypothetical protein